MADKRVLVSGASIAGPALAYWLDRYGFDVTVVEKADGIRAGGQAVDLKGPVHETVLRRMGIHDDVAAAHVANLDGVLVDARGRKVGVIPGAFAGGDINVPRGDLSAILYSLTAQRCEYLFGDSIASSTETGDGVDVTFVHGADRTFDIVVGADGMHSRVRALHFGPEEEFVRHLGHHYVLAGIDAGDEDVMYSEPGRMIATGSGKAPVFGVFTSGPMPGIRDDVELQKRTAAAAFAGGGWRMSEIAARMTTADDFYMDAISRVTMDRCTRGRIALVGDAAHGNALGGFGTGLALVAAYVLAGELARAKGDHATAFPAYESAIRDYAAASQTVNAGRLLAPATRVGVVARNLFFTALSVVGPLLTVVDRPATNIDLVDYERVAGVSRSITGPVVAPADLPAP